MQIALRSDWNRRSAAGSALLICTVSMIGAFTDTAGAAPPISLQASRISEGVQRIEIAPAAFTDIKEGPQARSLSIPLPSGETAELELQRFEVMAPGCRFLEVTPQGVIENAAPDLVLLRGQVAGQPMSHAFLGISADGIGNGYVEYRGERFFISTLRDEAGKTVSGSLTVSRQAPQSETPDVDSYCGVDSSLDRRQPDQDVRGSPTNGRGPRMAKVAIDADQAFVNLFPDSAAANAYIVQLVAATSDIYLRDLNLRLRLDFVRLWPAGGEPFGADDLFGFKVYWVNNENEDLYNFIHMLSGRRDMEYAGIAYIGGTCHADKTYGISGFLNGTFPTPVGPPTITNWDVIVPTHEMGHNCGTRHTHDTVHYNPPVDQCGSGVPARGTIMSYCHTHPGGTTNIDMWMHRRVEDVIEADFQAGGCFGYDCNGNGVEDATDISMGTSFDVNGDGIPDECQDCDQNGILDPIDIANGAPDVNGNGIPDVCEPDCNHNGVPDPYECGLTPSIDVNGNNIPDSCEPDCNGNSISDYIDVTTGGFADLDRNTIPDACQDCDANGVSDWLDLGRGENLYVADRADFVREYFRTSGYPIQNLGGGAVLDPYDCVFGSDRQLYVASFTNDRIVKINVDTGATSAFVAAGSGGLDGPASLVFGPNGNLFVASQVNSRVIQYDGATGALVGTFVAAGSGGLTTPYGLTFGPNGNLFVTSNNNTVIQFDGASGALVGTFVTAGSGGLSGPRGLTFVLNGDLVVASFTNSRLLRYNGTTGASLGQFNNGPTMDSAWGVRVGPDGNLYAVRSASTIRVQAYKPDSGMYLRSFVRADPPLASPTGLAFRPGFLHDCNGNRVLDACDPESSDLDLFVAQLLAEPPDPILVCMLDQNADGLLNGADIEGFVAKLLPP